MPYRLVVIGASLGGMEALKVVLGGLPPNFPMAVAVAQHRGTDHVGDLADLLARYCVLPVVEVEDKDPVAPGCVHLAPAGYHLLAEPGRFALSVDAPLRYARPSIDILFESAAESYGADVIGVVLTGSGDDGAAGLAAVKRRGGLALVQDPTSAEARAMPDSALRATTPDRVLPLRKIGAYLSLASLGRPAPKV
jgi:two-component system, chemotaxis family, protein-glutamate methylesterase/glutaminase